MLRWLELQSVHLTGDDDGFAQMHFGDVTALWGKNDAGKSTVLRSVDDALGWFSRDRPAGDADLSDGLTTRRMALAVEPWQAERLAEMARSDLEASDGGARVQVLGRAVEVRLDDDTREAWAVRNAREIFPAWLTLFMSQAGLEPAVCKELLRQAVESPTLILLGRGDRQWQAWFAVRGPLPADPSAWVPIAPAAWYPVGNEIFPVAIRAPADWRELAELFLARSQQMADAMLAVPGEWLQDAQVDSAMLAAQCRSVLEELANLRLPSFISSRYRLSFSICEDETPALWARRTDGGDPFPATRLAQGFHLWVQLALRDTSERARGLAEGFRRSTGGPAHDSLLGLSTCIRSGRDTGPADIAALVDRFDATWHSPRGYEDDDDDFTVLQHVRGPQQRLYIVDEPERHLHPAMQREASDWLKTFTLTPGTQLLLATHSPSFLRLPANAVFTWVERDADHHVILDPKNPYDMECAERYFRELGLDRGEALALYRAVLFVEGETDRQVLDVLCGERLRDRAILVQPLRGARNLERLLEAEMLLRVLGPPFHVLVDNVSEHRRQLLEQMSLERLVEVLENKTLRQEQGFTGELLWLAKLRRSALEQGRHVHIHTIPSRDILGILDDECVRDTIDARGFNGPTYPGFSEIATRYGESYNRELPQFGISKDPSFFRDVALTMRDRGISATELDGLIDAVWMSSTGFDI